MAVWVMTAVLLCIFGWRPAVCVLVAGLVAESVWFSMTAARTHRSKRAS